MFHHQCNNNNNNTRNRELRAAPIPLRIQSYDDWQVRSASDLGKCCCNKLSCWRVLRNKNTPIVLDTQKLKEWRSGLFQCYFPRILGKIVTSFHMKSWTLLSWNPSRTKKWFPTKSFLPTRITCKAVSANFMLIGVISKKNQILDHLIWSRFLGLCWISLFFYLQLIQWNSTRAIVFCHFGSWWSSFQWSQKEKLEKLCCEKLGVKLKLPFPRSRSSSLRLHLMNWTVLF